MNLKKGKKMFYECYGSVVSIDRNYGDEYRKCKIPQNIEDEWRSTIILSLTNDIANSAGARKFKYVSLLVQISERAKRIEILKGCLSLSQDSFSTLLYLESLKQEIINDEKNQIMEIIAKHKNFLLKTEFSIDESYYKEKYLKASDFSINHIRCRIESI